MATEAEEPMRLAPASSRARTWARVRMRPAGLDAAARAGYAAHQGDIGGGCAAGGEAGGGLDEVGAGLDGDFGGAQLFFHGEQAGFEIDLEQSAVMMGHVDDGVNGALDGLMVAALELADGKNHAELASTEADERRGLLAQSGDERRAKRESR